MAQQYSLPMMRSMACGRTGKGRRRRCLFLWWTRRALQSLFSPAVAWPSPCRGRLPSCFPGTCSVQVRLVTVPEHYRNNPSGGVEARARLCAGEGDEQLLALIPHQGPDKGLLYICSCALVASRNLTCWIEARKCSSCCCRRRAEAARSLGDETRSLAYPLHQAPRASARGGGRAWLLSPSNRDVQKTTSSIPQRHRCEGFWGGGGGQLCKPCHEPRPRRIRRKKEERIPVGSGATRCQALEGRGPKGRGPEVIWTCPFPPPPHVCGCGELC